MLVSDIMFGLTGLTFVNASHPRLSEFRNHLVVVMRKKQQGGNGGALRFCHSVSGHDFQSGGFFGDTKFGINLFSRDRRDVCFSVRGFHSDNIDIWEEESPVGHRTKLLHAPESMAFYFPLKSGFKVNSGRRESEAGTDTAICMRFGEFDQMIGEPDYSSICVNFNREYLENANQMLLPEAYSSNWTWCRSYPFQQTRHSASCAVWSTLPNLCDELSGRWRPVRRISFAVLDLPLPFGLAGSERQAPEICFRFSSRHGQGP